MSAKLCTVDVFFGPQVAGNRHYIAFSKAPVWEDIPAEYRQTPNLILLSGHSGAFRGQFISRGQQVRRCGSGNLAIAAYIHNKLAVKVSGERLLTPAGAIHLGFDRQSAYYIDKPVLQKSLHHSRFWQRLVRQPIINGCYCGHRNDYVLLELGQPLAQLRLNSKALCRFSRRALIAMYRPPGGPIQLRYFAPQYGQAEDAATGSASVQAAAYLRHQYPGYYAHQQIEFKQCSPDGGYLYLKNHRQSILVRGQTAIRGS